MQHFSFVSVTFEYDQLRLAQKKLTIGNYLAIGVSHKHESVHWESQNAQSYLAHEDKEDECRVLIEPHSCYSKKACAEIDFIPPEKNAA